MTRGRARFSSVLVQHGCKRRPYGLSARALSSLEVSYSYIRNSKDDKQVCNRRLSSAAIMTPFCQCWSHDFGSQAPPLFSCALKRSGRLGARLRNQHDAPKVFNSWILLKVLSLKVMVLYLPFDRCGRI